MNAGEYKAARKERGSQKEIAVRLGLSRSALVRRESGAVPVSLESEIALLALRKKRGAK